MRVRFVRNHRVLRISAGAVLAFAVGTSGSVHGAGSASAAVVPDDIWTHRSILNVAHAGGDLEAPHSTLYAMKRAVAGGADVLEMDLRLSSDGVLMVQHDDTVDRTTNATGPVDAFTAAELEALDNAYWFVPDCWSCHGQPDTDYALRGVRTGAVPPPAGFVADDFGVQRFATVAATFPTRTLDIEIKTGPDALKVADALAAFIASHGPSDRYLIASFDASILAYFKSIAPDVATSPSQDEMVDWFVNRGPMPAHRVLQVPPTFSGIDVVTQQFVDDAHANGLAVWVWFNGSDDDQAVEWQYLVDLGVDALLTGKPAAAQAVLDGSGATYRTAPRVAATATVKSNVASVDVSCPADQVDRCQSLVVLVAQNRAGAYELVGSGWADVARGTTTSVDVPLTRFARNRFVRGALPVVAVAWRGNADTEHALASLTLTRR